uniref:NADH-ubiquinone oxidoreductase chain 2 n=1 Tax=Riftia pachyptila TaxID=6426 RepID=Q642V8_RIFPA|nr:NADH dehydrogenase subunit 2 [Riftia pachyptila]AAU20750.1 NADH dehydrogenase subunit 2 [Riftia pachyptila]AIL54847.1 NADH dehydrogenase subunit 2 [Riftia pachyptila]WAB69326.1 NADH dehydrogenase subunit 2 [Riftia pachyptila]
MTAFTPATPLFIMTLILSTFLSISASHWLLLWLGLELNLLSFIPLIMTSKSLQESEGAIKYFMAQALGSALILLGALMMFNPHLSPQISTIPVILGAMNKLGLAPCHFWFPNVMASISWMSCLILSTWQKIIPLLILISLPMSQMSVFLMTTGALSSLVGGIGGMNQTSLRPLLAYSSIGHLGWMVCTSTVSLTSSFIYFFSYVLIILPIMLVLMSKNIFSNIQLFSMNKSKISFQLITASLFMSLGGLPPLFGFFPKWMAIQYMASSQMLILPLLLILGALMNLYFYLNLAFPMIINILNPSFMKKKESMSFTVMSSLLLGLSPLSLFLI